MTETEVLFETRKDISDYNTSYPLHPSDWSSWKTSDRLSFDDVEDLSFYIHIPFCQSLCRYCEYIKYKKTSESIERQYLDIVNGDMRAFAEQSATAKTILHGFDIGGGTPTVLNTENFAKLIEMSADYARRFVTILISSAGSLSDCRARIVPSCEITTETMDRHRGWPTSSAAAESKASTPSTWILCMVLLIRRKKK